MPPAFAHCCSAEGSEPGCETIAQPPRIESTHNRTKARPESAQMRRCARDISTRNSFAQAAISPWCQACGHIPPAHSSEMPSAMSPGWRSIPWPRRAPLRGPSRTRDGSSSVPPVGAMLAPEDGGSKAVVPLAQSKPASCHLGDWLSRASALYPSFVTRHSPCFSFTDPRSTQSDARRSVRTIRRGLM
jgi:hypothetical protein